MKRYPAKIRIWTSNGISRRSILINGKPMSYARWLFEKEVRPLKPGEVVHHKDENTLNDCIENYEAMPNGKHIGLHHKGMVHSKESRKKMGIKNLGNTHTLGYKHTNKSKMKIRKANSGENSNNSILIQKEVNEIRHKYFWEKDLSYSKLGDLYGVHSSTISSIVNGYRWNPNKLSKEKLINKSRILRFPF